MNPTAKLIYGSNYDLHAINEAVGTLQNAKAYVGIPEKGADRKSFDKLGRIQTYLGSVHPGNTGAQQIIAQLQQTGQITNAALLYIHTNGSQIRHIPPRPVIEPSIEANRVNIEDGLDAVVDALLDGKKTEARIKLKQVGTLAANGAKAWFTDPRNGWQQNAPSTIRRKLSKLKRKTVKANKRYLNAMTVLSLVTQNQPLYGTTPLDNINTPLIDTGELRRAITHVEEIL